MEERVGRAERSTHLEDFEVGAAHCCGYIKYFRWSKSSANGSVGSKMLN